MSAFNQMKSNRSNDLAKLTEQVNKLNSKPENMSDQFWKPVMDKAGVAFAVVRFLPAPPNEDSPFVRYWDHGFKGPGGWYIENSLTSLGQDDPLSKYNGELWATNDKAKQDYVRKTTKRKLRYVSNILVIKHSARKEDEGQVFKFRYGKKIFDMIQDKMHPQFENEVGFSPFDFWEGANFNLKIRTVDKFPNYEKSSFETPSPLFDTDEELEQVWKAEHSLQDILSPKNFKTYEQLEARMNLVLKLGTQTTASSMAANRTAPVAQDAGEDVPFEADEPTSSAPASSSDEEDFFKRLKDKA